MTGTAFGFWPSPLQAEQAAAGKVSLSELSSDGTNLYWLESRPSEGGRVVFVRSDGTTVRDLSPEGVNIRSRVHEYGGGASCLVPEHGPGAFAYVDLVEQRVWMSGGAPGETRPLSGQPPEGQVWAHGGLRATPDGDWVLAVREAHRPGEARPHHCVMAFGTRPHNAGDSMVLEGHDFYGATTANAEGGLVAATAWDHPDMPWDNSVVILVPVEVANEVEGEANLEGNDRTGRRGPSRLVATDVPWVVAGGDRESVGQPAWQSDGSLRFASDRAGWWQPYRQSGRPSENEPARPMTTEPAEFHGPDWVLGQSTMVALPDGSLVARRTSHGRDDLVHITAPDVAPATIAQPCVSISAVCRHGDGVAYIGGPADGPDDVWVLPSVREAARRLLPARAAATAIAPADVSVAEPFELAGRSGRPVHGVLYPPHLGQTRGPDGARPPLIVSCHGGPTASAGAGFDITVQYFTSRGFAVARVDYAGSTGYGRDYRCSLWGQWGVADAEDCVDAALHLAATGRVDGARLAIRGSSAGGLTALNALAAGEGFSVAVALYGVTDLVGLAASTHDFEARYMDRLIGPLPECRGVYEARSPVQRAAQMGGSVLLLQGTDDRVVPPAQAERLRDALVAAGRHCVVRFFEGEGHGFRRAETLVACLEEELDFYRTELRL
jgi:dipeptidyl aminopeptidase/acylaminoacyl peptidase